MKKLIPLLFVFALGCDKSDVKPIAEQPQSNERRGGNGNGNGNGGGGGSTNPCAWTVEYTNAAEPQENWGITVDTTTCGFVILRWPAQPKFSPVDSCTTAGRYYISTTTINGLSTGSPCAGNYTFTNSYYYQLGSGCSMWPGGEYRIGISYLERDTTAKVLRWHYSEGVQFKTGLRATFLGTCQ
jgi:hypothetical protein